MDCPVLRIGLSGFSPLDHYWLGQCIAQAVDALSRRAVFITSGDLSHKLRDDGPYGFAPEGSEFDRQITEAMADALDGLAVEAKLLSYEGITGVGYGVATFTVTGPDAGRRFGEQCGELERARLAEKKATEDPGSIWTGCPWSPL